MPIHAWKTLLQIPTFRHILVNYLQFFFKNISGKANYYLNLLTCPWASIVLLVSFSLLNETGLAVQWCPGAGESGCSIRRLGDCGSAPPAAAHAPPAHRHRLRPTSDSSSNTQYSSRGSRPERETRRDGNIRLEERTMVNEGYYDDDPT